MSTGITPVNRLDIFRYRYQHGTNLGSIFVLEKWMFGSMYSGSEGTSELDAVSASLAQNGLEGTRQKFEAHWRNSLTDDDLKWLRDEAKCNCIRLPIGYFTLGPRFCHGTPFAGQQGEVYENAWSVVKDIVFRCYAHGIGVLFDFHAVPGGANDEGHSGTDSHRAELWGNSANLQLANDCLTFMAHETVAARMDGVIGIQLCNEAGWDAPGMYPWYDSVIASISAVNPSVPIYISDGWDLGRALKYCISKNGFNGINNPVFVDNHKYYTFSESDRACSPQQIIERIPQEFGELDGNPGRVADSKGAMGVFVGEYSNALDTKTWARVDEGARSGLTQQFGRAQSQRWQEKAAGCAFWSFKFDWMDGYDWGFKAQTNANALSPPAAFMVPRSEVQPRTATAMQQKDSLMYSAFDAHRQWWDSQGSAWDHSSYLSGFSLGFDDASLFFGARAADIVPGNCTGGDKIGALDLWIRKRLVESGQAWQQYGWEWEHGFRKGVQDFQSAVGA